MTAVVNATEGYPLATRDLLLERLAESGSLLAVCRAPDMPSRTTVYNWLRSDPAWAEQYARAKAIGIDRYVEETTAIADAATPADVAVARLRVDTRHWVAERMLPKVYGPRAGLELSGGVAVVTLSPMERRQRIVSILATAAKREAEALVIENDLSDLA